MKELALYNLKEGMVLAKDITTPSGQVVLEKGKELTKQSILRLSFYNIKSACIVDGEEKQAAPKSYSQKIKTSQKFQSFQVDHTIVLSQIRVSFGLRERGQAVRHISAPVEGRRIVPVLQDFSGIV